MAFERIDSEALERGRARGFVFQSIDNSKHGWHEKVYKIDFDPTIAQGFTSGEIRALIEALIRFSGSSQTTIWIDITTDMVHVSLIEAIEELWYMEPRIYVSHKHMASHPPAPRLPDRLQTAVEKAVSRGKMWHPVRCISIWADPTEPLEE